LRQLVKTFLWLIFSTPVSSGLLVSGFEDHFTQQCMFNALDWHFLIFLRECEAVHPAQKNQPTYV